MKETPSFFPDRDGPLFGILHEPTGPSLGSAFVFCHPFAEEKLWTHRVFVSFARQLSEAGHPVLRFDYRGNGDSSGEFSESSLTTALADVRMAIDQVRRVTGASQVSLLGLRLGATIASLVAEDVRDVHQLILWAPIVDGAKYMQDMLRVNVMTQMAAYKEIRQDSSQLVAALAQGRTINIDGYEMAEPLYTEVSAVTLGSEPSRYEGPCLIVQVDRQTDRHLPGVSNLAASYGRATLAMVQEEPFWKEIQRFYREAPNLFGATRAWLNTR